MVGAPWISLCLALGASPPPRPAKLARAWSTRGVYTGRTDMPPLEEVASRCGVDPPLHAPRWVWTVAWRAGKRALPLLHRWDACAATDTNVNLVVCWLKAIAGNRPRGGCPDGGIAYDLLPPVTRRLVSAPVARFYPKLHHQNVALRTAFLDAAVERELAQSITSDGADSGPSQIVRAVVLGAGFDVRALRLSSQSARAAVWSEVDLAHVSKQKQAMLSRLGRRRPALLARLTALTQISGNLSRPGDVAFALRTAFGAARADKGTGTATAEPAKPAEELTAQVVAAGAAVRPTPGATVARRTPLAPEMHALVVIEALMIYLPAEAATALLRACVAEAEAAGAARLTICFSDRLPCGKSCSYEDAAAALATADPRLHLDEHSWLPKPGLARHQGVARAQLYCCSETVPSA